MSNCNSSLKKQQKVIVQKIRREIVQTLDNDKTNTLVYHLCSHTIKWLYIKKGYAFSYVQKFLLQN